MTPSLRNPRSLTLSPPIRLECSWTFLFLTRPLVAQRPGRTSEPLPRSEEHTSELQSLRHLVCRLLLEKKKRSRYLALPQRYHAPAQNGAPRHQRPVRLNLRG